MRSIPAQVRRVITRKTKLIVLTNLHNPSSVLASETALREIGGLARSVGARVLVDEVYLDAVYINTPKPAYHLGPEFVVTSSLTKVYGLSGLRCGWILAEPDLARAMWRLNDLFASIPAHPAELLSVVALENLDTIRDRARKIVEADRALLLRVSGQSGSGLHSPHRIWYDGNPAPGGREHRRFPDAPAHRLRNLSRPRTVFRSAQPFPHRHGSRPRDVPRRLAANRTSSEDRLKESGPIWCPGTESNVTTLSSLGILSPVSP